MVYDYMIQKMASANSRRDKQIAIVKVLLELAFRNNVPGDPFHDMLTKEGRTAAKGKQ